MLLLFTSGHPCFTSDGCKVGLHAILYTVFNSTVSRTAQAALNWEIYGVPYGVRGSHELTASRVLCPRQTGSSASHSCKIKPVQDHPGVATL